MKRDACMEVLRAAIKKELPGKEIVETLPFPDLYNLARENKMLPLLVNVISAWEREKKAEKELAECWKMEAMQFVMKEYRKVPLVQSLAKEAYARKLPLVFFKGYILAELYPDFTLRNSGDLDVYIDTCYKKDIIRLLEELGYIRDKKLDKEQVLTYRYFEQEECCLKIELHFSLFEDLTGEQIRKLEHMKLTDSKKYQYLDCCGIHLLSMGHMEHLIYQIFHMVKHFVYQGVPVRYVIDIAGFLKKYWNEIDGNAFWKAMDVLGYTQFVRQLFSICVQEFSVSEEVLGTYPIYSKQETQLLLEDLIQFGARAFGKEIAHYFLLWIGYYEQLDWKEKKKELAFDGSMVSFSLVPKEMQENIELQNRVYFMKSLELIE